MRSPTGFQLFYNRPVQHGNNHGHSSPANGAQRPAGGGAPWGAAPLAFASTRNDNNAGEFNLQQQQQQLQDSDSSGRMSNEPHLPGSSVGMGASIALSYDQQQYQQMQQQQQQNNNNNNQQKNPKLYKTELCRSWVDTGRCNYGERCQYAHGEREKRPIPRHPKYKTEACQSYHKTGYCPYGPRCHFIHNEEPHVIASLVAANNAAKAAAAAALAAGRSSGGSTPDVGPVGTVGTAGGPLGPVGTAGGPLGTGGPLRQIHSLGGASTPTTPRHGPAGGFDTAHSRSVDQYAKYGHHHASQNHHSNENGHQHQPLTQSVGGHMNGLMYTNVNSNVASHNNNYHMCYRHGDALPPSAPSASAAAFFNDAAAAVLPPGFGTEFFQRNNSQQFTATMTPRHHQRAAPLTAQPQAHSQFMFGGPSTRPGPDFRFFATGGGGASPPGSLVDSGTESPELLGSSSSGSGGFSPPGHDGAKNRLARLSPTSFRRHSSMLMMGVTPTDADALTSASYDSTSTILDQSKDDEGRNSDGGSAVMIDDEYLPTSPQAQTAAVDAKLIASFQHFTTAEHIEAFYGDGQTPKAGAPSAAEFFGKCATMRRQRSSAAGPIAPGDQRWASGSSLDSAGTTAVSSGSGLGTPKSTSSSAVSVADDQQWSIVGTTVGTPKAASRRIPLFERFSSAAAI